MSERNRIFPGDPMRSTLLEALPSDFSAHGQAPEPQSLYVPSRHSQALAPEHGLVVGIRGAGKSVWWAALQSEAHQKVIAALLPSLALDELFSVDPGFGEANRPHDYPDKRVLRQLLREGTSPADVWRGIVAWQTWGKQQAAEIAAPRATDSWSRWVAWVDAHPEDVARRFKTYDDDLATRRKKHLVLFDALDRAADIWPDLRRLLRGLLEVLLEFRSYRAIRIKAFIRPDMLDDPEVTSFPDASKVTASKVELRWARADLYGLLFQRLGNAKEGGALFRSGSERLGSVQWSQVGKIWQAPRQLGAAEDLQRTIFHEIAGPWMGRDARRGFPYTWLPNHLADAAAQVSPRSFLAAVREAAQSSGDYRDWSYALHYEAIKKGVQAASQIRVTEIQEDFFWVATVMGPLKGLNIPCQFALIENRWIEQNVVSQLRQQAEATDKLLPKHLDRGAVGLCDDLLDLALFSRQPDGRINMPDVYRVGFGLGRHGGVKPIR